MGDGLGELGDLGDLRDIEEVNEIELGGAELFVFEKIDGGV